MRTVQFTILAGSAAALLLLLPVSAVAQGPGGLGGFGGPSMSMMLGERAPAPREQLSPATIPLSILASSLKLTDEQRSKIAGIQAKFDLERRALAPSPLQPMSNRQGPGAGPYGGPGQDGPAIQGFGGPSGPRPSDFGGPGRPGGFGGPSMNMMGRPGGGPDQDEIEDLDAGGSDKITSLLSSGQQDSLRKLEHTLRNMRLAGISPDTFGKLNLSASQIDKIAALADSHRADVIKAIDSSTGPNSVQETLQRLRRELHEDLIATLTDDQATVVKAQQSDDGLMGGQSGFFGGMGGPGRQGGFQQGWGQQGGFRGDPNSMPPPPNGQYGQGGPGGPGSYPGLGGPNDPGAPGAPNDGPPPPPVQ